MPARGDDDDVARSSDAGIDDRDVHRAVRKVRVRPRQPEPRLRRPIHRHLVRDVDDSRGGQVREDAALHRRDERPLMTEVRRDRDDAAGCEHDGDYASYSTRPKSWTMTLRSLATKRNAASPAPMFQMSACNGSPG